VLAIALVSVAFAAVSVSEEQTKAFIVDIRQALCSPASDQLFRLMYTKGLNEMSVSFHKVRAAVISKKYQEKNFEVTIGPWPANEPTTVETDIGRKFFLINPSHRVVVHADGEKADADIVLPVAEIDGRLFVCCEQIVLKRAIKPSDLQPSSREEKKAK